MEVSAFRLRERGQKLSREQVNAAAPMVGFLRMDIWHLKNETEDRKVRCLQIKTADNVSSSALLIMNDVEITRLQGNDMVFVGTERVSGELFKQALWVRLQALPSRSR